MQIVAISKPSSDYERKLIDRQHQLRARVFAERLGWEVNVVDGRERDSFDALNATYILAVANKDSVVGCARLLPSLGPTMITDVFPSLIDGSSYSPNTTMAESSRFCVDTRLEQGRGHGSVHEATLTMFAGILEWSLANNVSEIVTVTDLRFERILARVGWPLTRIGEPEQIGVTEAVAGTLPVDMETFEALRPEEYASELRALAQAA